MRRIKTLALLGLLGVSALCAPAGAADIERLKADSPTSPFSEIVAVPPGYTTYYISGMLAKPLKPAAGGKPADWGDIAYATKGALESLKAQMTKEGLTFGDVVAAHVFMAPDPHVNGGIDFAGMNKVWLTYFGTKDQPNKPSRAAFKVASLASVGPLVEIEFVAAKKAK
ncbi:MAG TPA: Rid family hydrolase [Rhizomicrobium sp.]|nr:Rid family hydrolase [Rhizomicrobium sp.]HWC62769.1 Rid family hydrolase [Rhizomicrobium sp.]